MKPKKSTSCCSFLYAFQGNTGSRNSRVPLRVTDSFGISNGEWVFLESVFWDGHRFVVVGGSHLSIGGFSAISEDGINWSHHNYVLNNGGEFNSIAWSGSKYVVSSSGMSGRIFYSPQNQPNK